MPIGFSKQPFVTGYHNNIRVLSSKRLAQVIKSSNGDVPSVYKGFLRGPYIGFRGAKVLSGGNTAMIRYIVKLIENQ